MGAAAILRRCCTPRYSALSSARRPPLRPCAARFLLFFAASLFGSYSVLMRMLFATEGPPLPVASLTLLRFSLLSLFSAALFGAQTAAKRCSGREDTRVRPQCDAFVAAASELAIYDLLGNLLCTHGLETVRAVEAELLLSTMSLFVPVLSLCAGTVAGGRTWAGCILACVGVIVTALLAHGGGSANRRLSLSERAGLVELLVAAGSYAAGRVRLMIHLRRSFDPDQLVFGRVVGMTLGSALACGLDALHGGPTASLDLRTVTAEQWRILALSCALSGFLGCLAQFRGQTQLGAASAQPILALQPVFAACWAAILLAEPLSPWLVLGGGLILGGALLASTDPYGVAVQLLPAHMLAEEELTQAGAPWKPDDEPDNQRGAPQPAISAPVRWRAQGRGLAAWATRLWSGTRAGRGRGGRSTAGRGQRRSAVRGPRGKRPGPRAMPLITLATGAAVEEEDESGGLTFC